MTVGTFNCPVYISRSHKNLILLKSRTQKLVLAYVFASHLLAKQVLLSFSNPAKLSSFKYALEIVYLAKSSSCTVSHYLENE